MQDILAVLPPIFAIIFLAYAAARYGLISGASNRVFNTYVYYFALPAFLFLAIVQSSPEDIFNWPFIDANFLAIVICFLLGGAASFFIFKAPWKELPLQGMTTSFGTTAYMGVPLLLTAFGTSSSLAASLATFVHIVPMVVFVSIWFEIVGKEHPSFLHLIKDIIFVVIKNPLFIAVFAAAIFSIFSIPLPPAVLTLVTMFSNTVGTCSLFAIGLVLAHHIECPPTTKVNHSEVALFTAIKLLVQPLVVWLLSVYFFHLTGIWLKASILMSALPSGVTTYVLAQRYGCYESGCSRIIVISLMASVVTLTVLIAYLGPSAS